MAKPPELPPEVRKFFTDQGREGGKIGGKRRMDSMTPEQRSALGKMAVEARKAKAAKKARKAAKKKI